MENIKQKLRRSVLYLLGFSAFPMLTSCYGMPQDHVPYEPKPELKTTGKIVSKDKEPINGILVTGTKEDGRYSQDYSNYNGEYTIYERDDIRTVIFSDIDGDANGGDFQQQSKTIGEIKENGNIIMELKK